MLASRLVDMSNAVALRKESVDRNCYYSNKDADWVRVALRKESVDRNWCVREMVERGCWSLSARRAWIEIILSLCPCKHGKSRSPQGERG